MPGIRIWDYLRSSLKDSAASLINSLEFSEDNEDIACDFIQLNKILTLYDLSNYSAHLYNLTSVHNST